ncbi:MAG: cytochrome c oxidase subunit 3, partial [Candidatus Binatia bacterium]
MRSEIQRPPIPSALLGLLLFIAAEVMLFGGLIGAFLVFRFGSPEWPPPGMPKLPVTLTAVNTLVLFASCYPATRALRAIRRNDRQGLRQGVAMASLLGTIFLLVQGSEWIRLVGYGLRISSGPYGSTFYTLIGFHGLHVLGAVVWLLVILAGSMQERFGARHQTPVELATVYWYFVSGLWAVLFPLVYLGLG